MKSLENEKIRSLLFSVVGGVSAVVFALLMIFVRQLAANSSLCLSKGVSGMSPVCSYVGIVLPQFLLIAILALLIFLLFRKHLKYTFFIGFFTLSYAWYLKGAIGWLYNPMNVISSTWVFYALLFIVGGLISYLLYLYFVKLKMWLWLKLLLALLTLLALPLIILNIERELYLIFYV